jgi:AraC-like DNA-binding protein
MMQKIDAIVARRSDSADLEKVLGQQSCGMSVDVPIERQKCTTQLQSVNIDALVVARYDGSGYRIGRRRPDHIRADHSDFFLLTIPLVGRVGICQDGRDIVFGEEEFALMATVRPFMSFLSGFKQSESFSTLQVRIPGPLMRQRAPNIDAVCSTSIDVCHGAGSIMKSVIDAALRYGPDLSEQQARSFSAILIDVIANAALPVLEQTEFYKAERKTAKVNIRERAKRFILSNLSDPNLRVPAVANHCHVSLRYLHAAFAQTSESVEAFIKEVRLQQCRTVLRDASLRDRPIATLAAEWGFDDPAYFSNAYKTRFGIPPSHDRRLQQTS